MIPRYSTPEMCELWSEDAKYRSWLDVELAACEAWSDEGKIPAADLETIRAKAKFDANRIEELETRLHHDVVAFTTNLSENIGESSRYVHLGLTSNDVVDTAQALRLKRAGALILDELDELTEVVRQSAVNHKRVIMIGRTHGVHAEPVTLGLKFLVYYRELLRDRRRLAAAFDETAVGKISGVVGTYAHTGPEFEKRVCAKLGVGAAEVSTQVLQRDRHAALIAAAAITGATIEKIATEIRGLQRTEVREVEEPFTAGQKGSSAMPHKRNPVKCEQLCGLARLLRGYAVPAIENIVLWHERDISHSSAERVILADATTLLHYMLRQARKIISGLHIHPENMKRNLELTRGLLFSQRALLELVERGLSREQAYEIVQEAAMRTWEKEQTTLRDELLADKRLTAHMSAGELDAIMDYGCFLKYLDDIFDNAL
ncbi:MAG: adenylosuccinate lyase [Candidatus Sumerlaeota bacterium]|nr:adenylosuccinate lyase [Candidatus Sumerlaeota bacterium]